ncbi:helix-turn-helix domain-containing protein [Allofournierella sp.]|uniref:helix-turn-helix domain-containing protein n=1 Tax=Allofournierella sp. TaxID=1940256 RepID=UPI003AB60D56
MVYDFGIRLKELREKRGLSQAQAAKRLGISRSAIANYENDLSQPSADMLKTLAVFYHTSVDYLLGLEERKIVALDTLTKEEQGAMSAILDIIMDKRDGQ